MSRTEKIYSHYIEKLDEFKELLAAEFQKIIDGKNSMYFGRIHELEKFGIRTGNKYVDTDSVNLEKRENELDRLGEKLSDNTYKEVENIVEEYVDKVYRAGNYEKSYRVFLAKQLLEQLMKT